VAKAKHAVAIAEEGRTGEVRYFGEIGAEPVSVRRMVAIHLSKHRPFVVNAGDLPRDIVALAAFARYQGPAPSAERSSQMRMRTIQRP
jgi:hypothetical protein